MIIPKNRGQQRLAYSFLFQSRTGFGGHYFHWLAFIVCLPGVIANNNPQFGKIPVNRFNVATNSLQIFADLASYSVCHFGFSSPGVRRNRRQSFYNLLWNYVTANWLALFRPRRINSRRLLDVFDLTRAQS